MSTRRTGTPNVSANLVVLPVSDELRRERFSAVHLDEQPAEVQGWFEANGHDPESDARLNRFIEGLLADPVAQTPAAADAPAAADEPAATDSSPLTLDDEGPSTLELRLQRQERRLAAQPVVLARWFEACADGAEADRRLQAFAARQLDIGPAMPTAKAANNVWRYSPLAIAASALLAVGVAAWWGHSPSDTPVTPQGNAQLAVASPSAGAPTWVGPAAAQAGDAVAGAPERSGSASESDLSHAAPPSAPRAPVSVTAGDPVPASVVVELAPAVAVVEMESMLPSAPVLSLVEQAPTSPALRAAGEIDAESTSWVGTIVPGLELRVVNGYAQLSGTEANPRLRLASDSSVRVDLDRSAVGQGFSTFTIETASGTVSVIGTRYTVQTPGGRTEVATRRGLVQLSCQDGRKKLIAAGQEGSCEAIGDSRLLSHMQALDRPMLPDQVRLTEQEQYHHLRAQLAETSPEAFVATADLVLSRALSDDGLRRVIDAVRIEALCALGWQGPARRAAVAWLQGDGDVGRERVDQIANGECPAG